MSSTSESLHNSLLRPPIVQILRAAGFQSTRPSVLDTVVDLTSRYITLLASTTASYTSSNANVPQPHIEDVRMAMEECGVFRPQRSFEEEEWTDDEDLRGVQAFVDWITGDINREIRRVAGMADAVAGTGAGPNGATAAQMAGAAVAKNQTRTSSRGVDAAQVEGLLQGTEDYLQALKKKHTKTGDEQRYQGTVLGITGEQHAVKVEGGPMGSIQDWEKQVYSKLEEAMREPERTTKDNDTMIE